MDGRMPVVRTPAMTVRVTVTRGAERPRETCTHDEGGGGGAAGWEGDGRWPALHTKERERERERALRVRVKGAQGVKEVERQLRVSSYKVSRRTSEMCFFEGLEGCGSGGWRNPVPPP